MSKAMDRCLEELTLDEALPALDEDALVRIFNQCSVRDCIRMGAVCKSWLKVSRWSIKTCTRELPWLMMLSDPTSYKRIRRPRPLPWLAPDSRRRSTEEEEKDEVRCFFSISHNIYHTFKFPEMRGMCCCGSLNNGYARGWLMTINNENLDMRLFHPWRRIQLQLPHHSTLRRPHPPVRADPFDLYLVDVKLRKAAMSDDESVVVVIHDLLALAFWRRGDKIWTPIRNSSRDNVSDVLFHKGKFYAVTCDGVLAIIHINTTNPYIEPLTDPIKKILDRRIYLAADSISEGFFIFMRIKSNIHMTSDFKIYEVVLAETGEYKKDLVEVRSLGDRVVFLGQNSSILVVASKFPGLKGNRIYFTDDLLEAHLHEPPLGIGSADLGVFNIEDRTIQPILPDRYHPTFSPPVWITPPW